MTPLKVNDIFESISGETGGFPQGTWCTFIRLQGCNLRCAWCDTPQGQDKNAGYSMSILDVIASVKRFNNKHILITGGEPLMQPQVIELMVGLLEEGYEVQIETNGSLVIPPIPQVHWVVDYKCPSSGVMEKMIPLPSFTQQLLSLQKWQTTLGSGSAWVKYVITDDDDLTYALETIKFMLDYGLIVPQVISPINADGSMVTGIVSRIRGSCPSLLNQIIFSVQLHKIFDLA